MIPLLKNNTKKKQQINIRFFLPFTVLIIVIVIALTSTMYYNYQETTLPIIYDHISENLQQSGYSARYMMSSVNNLLSQMYLDSKITTLMYSTGGHNALELRTGQKTLSSYKNSSPFVHSIYVYNANLDSFFTSQPNIGLQNSEDFFDDTILGLIQSYDTSNRLEPIPRPIRLDSVPFSEERFIDCYTFIYFENLEDGQIKDAIIVNVNQAYVHELLSDYETKLQSTKVITDYNGTVVLDSHRFGLSMKLSEERFMNIILKENASQGYFVSTVDGTRSLVSFSKLDTPRWIMVDITPFDYLSDRLERIKVFSLLITLALIIIGVLSSTLLSRYKYRPIRKVLDDVSVLEDNRRKNYFNLKQSFMRKLVQMKSSDLMTVEDSFLNRYELKFDIAASCQMILIGIDGYKAFQKDTSLEDQELMRFGIINIAEELCGTYRNCECIDMQNDHLVLVYNVNSANEADSKREVIKLCEQIQDKLKTLLHLHTTLIISPKSVRLPGLNAIYSDALFALDYRLTDGSGSIIDYEEIADKGLEPYEMDAKRLKKLIESVMSAKQTDAISQYEEILFEAVDCTADSIKHLHIQLAFALNDALVFIKTQNDHSLMDLDHIITSIDDAETIDELKGLFVEYFESVSLLIGTISQPKHQDLVENIKTYIQEHFSDENLSLNMMADHFDMSPLYTGRLFKQQAGISIANFINEVRLETAEHLLKDTNHTINEIADMIGVTNTNYFYSLFKKKYGVTPTVYRKQVIANK